MTVSGGPEGSALAKDSPEKSVQLLKDRSIRFLVSMDHNTDVLIIGSGAAGLTAAIVAHDNNCEVTLLEKSNKIGGATSVSAGDVWIPNNKYMQDIGSSDSEEKALRYLENFKTVLTDESLIQTYVETAPEALRYLSEKTPLKLEPRHFPDYHAEFEGGNVGRTLGTATFDANSELGEEWAQRVRASLVFPPVTFAEVERKSGRIGGIARADKQVLQVIADRISKNVRGLGSALSCMLLKACLDRGIAPMLETRATRLLRDDSGCVTGVLASKNSGENDKFLARKAVILASGGYDWNDDYRSKFLMFPWAVPLSPPCIEGDGLSMGIEVGAEIVKMPHAFWAPAAAIPGEQFEGKQLYRFIAFERIQPGSIVVNKRGKRFTNEAVNYHDFVRGLHSYDSFEATYPNIDCWMIFDENFRSKYIIAGSVPEAPVPAWIVSGQSLDQLSKNLGIDGKGLEETVSEFNEAARKGVDLKFHRGDGIHDKQWSDPDHKPNPSLGVIEKPPFYALKLLPGFFGTTGGLRINSKSMVLDRHGNAIPRLYACGNVAGHPFAPAYPASGSGLGNAITFGFIAGTEVSKEKSVDEA